MNPQSVIPAKAGIHTRIGSGSIGMSRLWIPAFAGMTTEGGVA